LREREGPAAEGGGRVRVFFLLFQLNSLGRRKKTLTQTLSRVRERAFR